MSDVYIQHEFIDGEPVMERKITKKSKGMDAGSSSSDSGDLDFHLLLLRVSIDLQIIYIFQLKLVISYYLLKLVKVSKYFKLNFFF